MRGAQGPRAAWSEAVPRRNVHAQLEGELRRTEAAGVDLRAARRKARAVSSRADGIKEQRELALLAWPLEARAIEHVLRPLAVADILQAGDTGGDEAFFVADGRGADLEDAPGAVTAADAHHLAVGDVPEEQRAAEWPLLGGVAGTVGTAGMPVVVLLDAERGEESLAQQLANALVGEDEAAGRRFCDDDGQRHLVEHRLQEGALQAELPDKFLQDLGVATDGDAGAGSRKCGGQRDARHAAMHAAFC